ncbi:MAG: Zn-dependent hydrolase [Pseudomonadota bacterium]|uniref:Zn-dependent hydrolase n=1 Tax=Rhizorhabdus wittichii TaxID=160791 RepID=UPI0006801ECE|nr:Zn-dependent hydrolase [Rhizorhabdus wittichii]
MPAIRVNRDRLWNSLMEMGEIGGLPHGGCRRLALSDDDGAGRDLFVRWCREAGCEIGVDQVGNVFARRPGWDADAPAVATGSHLDTQPHGGKFDGIYGVLAGLEIVRTLNDHGVETRRPIDIVVWTNEEASRFYPPLTGSSAFAGLLDPADVHRVETFDGTLVGDDLRRIGYLGEEVPGSRALDSFVELHIEQGPILEAEAKTIGVVTRIQGLRFMTVVVSGDDGHAGTLPMSRRRDALVGAARMTLFLDELARTTDDAARITVGSLHVSPNSTSTVPGEVKFTIDLRHPDEATLVALADTIQAKLPELAGTSGLGVAIAIGLEKKPVIFDDAISAQIQAAADELGFASRPILSGAGHDAMNMAPLMPTGMIFIPCAAGISHNEQENADPDHVAAGADVLLHVLLERATA